jgi:serine/threonine-protein kinase
MGEVRLALDQDIGRRVAVKRLIEEDNPLALARFVDEVRTIGNLEHPNIVPIHDVGVDADGSLFFVMKYVEGETLASIIGKLASGDEASHRRFPFEARLDLFAGLLRALQYAHDQGLVHRDVKPENIMVGQFGEVMLMDWGIARRNRSDGPRVDRPPIGRAAGETLDGTIIGTPRYMSPEQAAGQVAELDGRSDLYSAFVVLYELLTTRSYIEPTARAIQSVAAARDRQPPKLTDPAFSNPHQDSVPGELRHFLRRGLAPCKEERFTDASDVIQELERIRSGACKVQCPLTFIKANSTRYGRFMDGHPALGLLAATLAVSACATGLFAWAMWLFQLVGR